MAKTQNPSGGQTGDVSNYLKGVDFPAKKNDIISAARKNNAPNDVMQRLQEMPDQRFERQQEVQDILQNRTKGGQSQVGQTSGAQNKGGQSNR